MIQAIPGYNHGISSKSCLKIWLGMLLAISYLLVILFTALNHKRQASVEMVQRVKLPSSKNLLSSDHFLDQIPQVNLDSTSIDKTIHTQEVQEVFIKQSQSSQKEQTQGQGEFNAQDWVQSDLDAKISIKLKALESFNASTVYIRTLPNNNHTKFATFGFTTPGTEDYFYAFNAPLAVRAWKRIGYDSIVFIVGESKEWRTRDILKHIYAELISLDPVIIFLETKQDNEILVSQICRLFAANFFTWKNPGGTQLVTSDADLWPLNAAMYGLPEGKHIMSLNSDCCGTFDHKGHILRLLPLGSIVADVTTWKQIMNVHGFSPRSVEEMLHYFFREFGPIALERTKKVEYIGWYLDQRMVSLRISDWIMNNSESVQFVPRDVGRDRIDSNYWMPYSIYSRNDVHLLPDTYKPGVWEKLRPLIRLMYSKEEEYQVVEYREAFMRLYMRKHVFR